MRTFRNSSFKKWLLPGLASGILMFSAVLPGCTGQTASAQEEPQYQVGVCDWMILKRQKLGAFKLASEIRADGIELDMGPLGDRVQFESQLDDTAGRRKFMEEAAKYDLGLSSIAMSGFYGQDFAHRDEFRELTVQAINTAKELGVKVIFLPLGVQSNPKAHPDLRGVLVERLKEVGDLAAAEGIVIAIASSLPSAEDVVFLREIGSAGIKASVNFSDVIENGEDIPTALRNWGRENIAQIHVSNTDGFWIENDPAIDLPAVKTTLDEMGWSGWLLIERSRDPEIVREVKTNFSANAAYVKSVFQPQAAENEEK